MEKKILTYGFDKDSERYKKILELSKKFNIDVIEASENELNEKVGYLMGLSEYEKSNKENSHNKEIEFLMFSDFDRKKLSDFLVTLKNEGVTVPHKSVITKMTKDWSLIELLDHIEDEHRVMQKFNVLGKMVKDAKIKLETEENKELELAVNSALELTKMKEVTEKDVDEKFQLFEGLL